MIVNDNGYPRTVRTLTEYLTEVVARGDWDELSPPRYRDATGETVARIGRRLWTSNGLGDWSDTYPTETEAAEALEALACGHGTPADRPCYDCDDEMRADLAHRRWKEGA